MDNNENRARQFLPFDALSGLKEALHEKEVEHDAKLELSDEQIEVISNSILNLEEKEKIEVTYYNGRIYEKKNGTLDKVDYIRKKIIVDEMKINFYDILSIRRCN